MVGQVFPWREGNSLTLLSDGPDFFPRMIACVDAAREQVELEQYLVTSSACTDAVLRALCEAARRGVVVRCLFGAFGCQGLSARDRQWLLDSGVEIRWYNPLRWRRGVRNLYRDHRKLLVVDGNVAFVGGTGCTEEFWVPGEAASAWHEVMVEMRGPLVADWLQLFDRQWQANNSRFAWRPYLTAHRKPLPQRPAAGAGWGRVAYADARQHRDILQSLIRALNAAEQRVWLATPYFLPTWKVRRALRKAAARGVDVRLLLSGRHTDNPPVRFAGQRYYPRLLRAGVRIFEFRPRFLHLKMVLVDDWVSVGSCNFDHWNLRFNLDANVEVVDMAFMQAVEQSFEADFGQSREVDLDMWQARPLGKRLRQRLWGWLDRLVVNLLDRRR